MRYFKEIVLSLFFYAQVYSQCTSGCCSPGTANFGVMEKGDLLCFSFFKRDYSDTYFRGSKPVQFNYLTNDYDDYSGLSLSYGITSKFTAQATIGYFIAKTENFNIPVIGQQQLLGQGFADAELYGKYNVYNAKNDLLSVTVSAGVRLPTGPYNLSVYNVELPRDIQAGSGAYSGVLIFTSILKPFKNKNYSILVNSRMDMNGVNPEGYRYGISNVNIVSTSFKVYKAVSGIIMLRNENRDCDKVNNLRIASTAASRLFISPGITISPGHDLILALYADVPLYQYYSGVQLAAKYAFSVAVSKVFEFHKKPVTNMLN